jgi:hypothetical protein
MQTTKAIPTPSLAVADESTVGGVAAPVPIAPQLCRDLAGLTLARDRSARPYHLSPPDHRWEIATSIVAGTASRRMFGDAADRSVTCLTRYLRLRRQSSTKSIEWFPNISHAVRLRFISDDLTRAILEARLLTGEPVSDSAAKCNLPIDVVKWYALLFFAVSDKLRYRQYIISQAVGPRYFTGYTEDDVDILLKSLAYLRGPVFLDYILSFFTTQYRVPDRLDNLTLSELEQLGYFAAMKAMITALTVPKVATLRPGEMGSAIKTAAQWRGLADEVAKAISEVRARVQAHGSLSVASCRCLVASFVDTRSHPEAPAQDAALAG